jgi:hypothetical protein
MKQKNQSRKDIQKFIIPVKNPGREQQSKDLWKHHKSINNQILILMLAIELFKIIYQIISLNILKVVPNFHFSK